MREHKLVRRDAKSETFLIIWPPGTGLDWHTHGASTAEIEVLEGELTEWIRDDTAAKLTGQLKHGRGAIVHREPYTAHKVVNQTRKPAVSLHTYTPPLTITFNENLEIY